MDARNYTEATRKALFTLSLGRCYEPNCQELVIRMADDGTPIVLVQIAHIRAAKRGGPRYDESMNNDSRRAFTNLLLLCTYHHKLVDNLPTGLRYSVETLTEWKAAREGQMSDDLRMLTEDRLIDILGSELGDVILDTKNELMEAIGEVEEISREGAGMLRTLVNETFKRPHLDPEAIASLADSANTLRGVTEYAPMLHESSTSLSRSLPDYAPMLARSSSQLRDLPDYASMLALSSSKLQGLPDWVAMLEQATRKLSYLPDHTPRFAQACDALANVPEHAQILHTAANAVSDTANQLHNVLNKLSALRETDLTSKLDGSAALISKTAEEIYDAAETASAIATGQQPDRLSYLMRGVVIGLAIAAILTLGIWYLASR
ncbi:hypothetical protein FPZ12_020305 [Amycolatopsis acidicola]|uniref:HNH endonuclease n=1 Tax=Amycolatopsis acidicola TaxID=2596893 RepID=A0A5N0V004_9PSEU|nr:hypothetical protein [Amycolatopsis acidicola]KAA9159447.1 hypothetical protein FPZ12_020305 [Amycolatopsis acidicola]